MNREGRKVRKYRGSRTHGYGRVGQHRKGGQRGGKGNVGRRKHFWIRTLKYEADTIGKKGFNRPDKLHPPIRVINVGILDQQIPTLLNKGLAVKKEGKTIIDLTSMGINKLLGKGRVTNCLHVTVPLASNLAKTKIEKSKGKIITTQKES